MVQNIYTCKKTAFLLPLILLILMPNNILSGIGELGERDLDLVIQICTQIKTSNYLLYNYVFLNRFNSMCRACFFLLNNTYRG